MDGFREVPDFAEAVGGCNRTIILKIKFFFQRSGPHLSSPVVVHLTLAAWINFREVENFPEVERGGPLRFLLDKVSLLE